MKERRFKIALVSDHIAVQLGKDLGKAIQDSMPDDAVVLKQEADFRRASLSILIYHPKFEIIPDGQEVPIMLLDIKLPEKQDKKVILPYKH